MKATIIVTGGTGFIGAHVCRDLARKGARVIAIGIEPPSEETRFIFDGAAVEFIHCDVTDASALDLICAIQKPSVVVHAAGYVGQDASIANPALTYAINIGGTVNALEAARRNGVSKFILISSNAAYQKKAYEPFDEKHPVTSIYEGNPNAHYGTAKMASEQIGLSYHSLYGLDFLAIRVTAVYGFGMRIPMYIKPLVEGALLHQPVHLPSGGKMRRDYTYIDDVALGIVLAVETDTAKMKQRVFNMSCGKLVTASEIVTVVREVILGADVKISTSSTALEKAGARQRAALDSDAARRAFGYCPRYTIETGIAEYAKATARFHESAG